MLDANEFRHKKLLVLIAAVTILSAPAPWATAKTPATQPDQPVTGPGGSEYKNASVSQHSYSSGDLEYWLFEPRDPQPKSAPVVIFNHGWGAMTPGVYQAWIDHIVKRGNIVIYPRYQASLKTPTRNFLTNAVAATKQALDKLQNEPGHTKPMLDKVAVVGHSAGGQTAANMAAVAADSGLPPLKAIMCVQPGKSWNLAHRIGIPILDLSRVPADTLLVTVVGDKDTIVKDIDAKRIFTETINVPKKNKAYVILVSDNHGNPPLTANHFAPCAPCAPLPRSQSDRSQNSDPDPLSSPDDEPSHTGPIRALIRERLRQRLAAQTNSHGESEAVRGLNALDFYGTWKLFDALCDAAFYDRNRQYALGDTPQQRYMGKWSDGVPVKELIVKDNP